MSAEDSPKPGMVEQAFNIARNAGIAVAAIAAWFGSWGAAAFAGIFSVFSNEEAKLVKQLRTG